jgi:hypothetical protein
VLSFYIIFVIIFCKQLRKIARFTVAKWNKAATFKKLIIHNPVIIYVCVKSSKETLLIYDYGPVLPGDTNTVVE